LKKYRADRQTLLSMHRHTSSTASGPPSPKGKATSRDDVLCM